MKPYICPHLMIHDARLFTQKTTGLNVTREDVFVALFIIISRTESIWVKSCLRGGIRPDAPLGATRRRCFSLMNRSGSAEGAQWKFLHKVTRSCLIHLYEIAVFITIQPLLCGIKHNILYYLLYFCIVPPLVSNYLRGLDPLPDEDF